ncbi:WD40 repeat domain-containing protein [Streptomyces sp. NPDC101110]|uniref:WD40 repeat domain-containing protein n=1 Tax=Streptomyces sp. NPDC101110 TaxID=3366104 RepID=UPI0037F37CB4
MKRALGIAAGLHLHTRRLRILAAALVLLVAIGVGVGVALWKPHKGPSGHSQRSEQAEPRPRFFLSELPTTGQDRVTAVTAISQRLFVLGTSAGKVHLVSLNDAAAPQFLTSVPGGVEDLHVSRDSSTVAAVSDTGFIRAVKIRGGAPKDFKIDPYEAAGNLSRSGRTFVYGQFDIHLVNVATGLSIAYPDKPPPDGGRTAYEDWAVTDNGRLLAASLEGVETWRTGNPRYTAKPATCQCAANGVRLSDDGQLAIFGTADGHAVTVDVETRTVLHDKTVSALPNDHIFEVAVLGSGRYYAAGTSFSRAVIWEAEKQQTVWDHTFSRQDIRDVSAVPGSDSLLVVTTPHEEESEIRAWIVSPARSKRAPG